MHFTKELQRHHGREGLNTYSLHPGAVYTHIADRGLEGQKLLGWIRKLFAPIEARMLLTQEQGAQTTLYCATIPHRAGGDYFVDCAVAAPSKDALDSDVASKLWESTDLWVKSLHQ